MILETLCRGNYSPPDMLAPTDPEYWEANKKVSNILDQLKSQLAPAQYNLIEDLTSQIYTAQGLECESYFKLGFASGMAIEREVHEELVRVD